MEVTSEQNQGPEEAVAPYVDTHTMRMHTQWCVCVFEFTDKFCMCVGERVQIILYIKHNTYK